MRYFLRGLKSSLDRGVVNLVSNRKISDEDVKETPAQKFFREREEKLAKKKKWEEKKRKREEKRKGVKGSSSNKKMDMNGSFPTNPAVYKLVNMRTGEVFVSNSKNMDNGVKRHLSNLRNRVHVNPDLQEDYNKGDRFYVVILREYYYYDRKVINQDTREYIEHENSYHSGYNRYIGGGFNPYENNPNHDTGRRLDGSPSSP